MPLDKSNFRSYLFNQVKKELNDINAQDSVINYLIEENLLNYPDLQSRYKKFYEGQRDLSLSVSNIVVEDVEIPNEFEGSVILIKENEESERIEYNASLTLDGYITKFSKETAKKIVESDKKQDLAHLATVNFLHAINENDAKIAAFFTTLESYDITEGKTEEEKLKEKDVIEKLTKSFGEYQEYLNSFRSVILSIDSVVAQLENADDVRKTLTALAFDLISKKDDSLISKVLGFFKPELENPALNIAIDKLSNSLKEALRKKEDFDKNKNFSINEEMLEFLSPLILIKDTVLKPIDKLKNISDQVKELNRIISNEDQVNTFEIIQKVTSGIENIATTGDHLLRLTGNDVGLDNVARIVKNIGNKVAIFQEKFEIFFQQNFDDNLSAVMRTIYPLHAKEKGKGKVIKLDELHLFYDFYLKNEGKTSHLGTVNLEKTLFYYNLNHLVGPQRVYTVKNGEKTPQDLYIEYQTFAMKAKQMEMPLQEHLSKVNQAVKESVKKSGKENGSQDILEASLDGSVQYMIKSDVSPDERIVLAAARLKFLKNQISSNKITRYKLYQELIDSFNEIKLINGHEGYNYKKAVNQFNEKLLSPFAIASIGAFRPSKLIKLIEEKIDLLEEKISLNEELKPQLEHLTAIYSKLQTGLFNIVEIKDLNDIVELSPKDAPHLEDWQREINSIKKIHELIEVSSLKGSLPNKLEKNVLTSKQAKAKNLEQLDIFITTLRGTFKELLDSHINEINKVKQLIGEDSLLKKQLEKKKKLCENLQEAVGKLTIKNIENIININELNLNFLAPKAKSLVTQKIQNLKDSWDKASYQSLFLNFYELIISPEEKVQALLIQNLFPQEALAQIEVFKDFQDGLSFNPMLNNGVLAEPLGYNEFNKNFFIDKIANNFKTQLTQSTLSWLFSLMPNVDLVERIKEKLSFSKKFSQVNALNFLEKVVLVSKPDLSQVSRQDLTADFPRLFAEYREMKLASATPQQLKAYIKDILFSEIAPPLDDENVDKLYQKLESIENPIFNKAKKDQNLQPSDSSLSQISQDIIDLLNKNVEYGVSEQLNLQHQVYTGLRYFYIEKLFSSLNQSASPEKARQFCIKCQDYCKTAWSKIPEEMKESFKQPYKELEARINAQILQELNKELVKIKSKLQDLNTKKAEGILDDAILHSSDSPTRNVFVNFNQGLKEFKKRPIISIGKFVRFVINSIATVGVWYGVGVTIGGIFTTGGVSSALLLSLGTTPIGISILGLTVGSFLVGSASRALQAFRKDQQQDALKKPLLVEDGKKEIKSNKLLSFLKDAAKYLLIGAGQTILSTKVFTSLAKKINEGKKVMKAAKEFSERITSLYPAKGILEGQKIQINTLNDLQSPLLKINKFVDRKSVENFQKNYINFLSAFKKLQQSFEKYPSLSQTDYGREMMVYFQHMGDFKNYIEDISVMLPKESKVPIDKENGFVKKNCESINIKNRHKEYVPSAPISKENEKEIEEEKENIDDKNTSRLSRDTSNIGF